MNGIERIVKNRGWLVIAGMLATACSAGEPLAVPDGPDIEGYYAYGNGLTADINGNVAEITINQSADQLRRGGALWAKVGPYVVLFTDETRQLFEDYPGLAGVRVITRVTNGPEVARALLHRSAMSEVQWRRGLNIAGLARRDGTQRVGLMQDLVRWGEDHTDHEYNPRYTSR